MTATLDREVVVTGSDAMTMPDGRVVPVRSVPSGERRRRFLRFVAKHAILIAVSAMFMVPIAFVVLTSLMTDQEALSTTIWPSSFQWSNYSQVFAEVPFLRWTFNTFLIAILGTIGTVVSSVPPAYALSRMRWKGRTVTFWFIIATMMLPFQVTVISLYIIFVRLGWVPGMLPLIVPAFFGDAFSIFLLRQFFASIPEELSDAARVDGASEWAIMTKLVIPLAKPAIAAVALFSFLGAWNDFFGPLLYLIENQDLWTIAIGLNEFKGLHHVEANLQMAASVMFMIPAIILFFSAQKVFIEGVTLTGVKG
jgi:multiple sugar transport system permease protein